VEGAKRGDFATLWVGTLCDGNDELRGGCGETLLTWPEDDGRQGVWPCGESGRDGAAWGLLGRRVAPRGRAAVFPPLFFSQLRIGRTALRFGDADAVGFTMRLIVGIACLLLGMGMLSCRLDGLTSSEAAERPTTEPHAAEWVRTVDGWERVDSWYLGEVMPPRLHPLVVAAGQGLLSLLGLALCQRER
jgi:hypothetical protein